MVARRTRRVVRRAGSSTTRSSRPARDGHPASTPACAPIPPFRADHRRLGHGRARSRGVDGGVKASRRVPEGAQTAGPGQGLARPSLIASTAPSRPGQLPGRGAHPAASPPGRARDHHRRPPAPDRTPPGCPTHLHPSSSSHPRRPARPRTQRPTPEGRKQASSPSPGRRRRRPHKPTLAPARRCCSGPPRTAAAA